VTGRSGTTTAPMSWRPRNCHARLLLSVQEDRASQSNNGDNIRAAYGAMATAGPTPFTSERQKPPLPASSMRCPAGSKRQWSFVPPQSQV